MKIMVLSHELVVVPDLDRLPNSTSARCQTATGGSAQHTPASGEDCAAEPFRNPVRGQCRFPCGGNANSLEATRPTPE